MTVGLVFVSHSRALAEGAAELVGQLTAGGVPAIAAGGLADGGLGTSPELITAAIARADVGDGVVVLADLGSAVLSARLVVEDLTDVRLADAPFVEGAVAAGVAASTGVDLAGVCGAAEDAWSYRKGIG